MRKINFTDVTIKNTGNLTFKEKIEMAKIMDRLNYGSIDMPEILNVQTDSLLIKTLALTLKECRLVIPVGMNKDNILPIWEALKAAKKPALKVSLPVSIVGMEYVCHRKPQKVLELITELVSECCKYCNNVEFEAEDATRAEYDFLLTALHSAIDAGANKITICDSASATLPSEFGEFIAKLIKDIPELTTKHLTVYVSNELNMAVAADFSAVLAGATEIKVSNKNIVEAVNVIDIRGGDLGIRTSIRKTELVRGVSQMVWAPAVTELTVREKPENEDAPKLKLTLEDDIDTVISAALSIGYELSPEDKSKVYSAFKRVASKKSSIGTKELEVIIATTALTVPNSYELVSYVINSGNTITCTASIKLKKEDEELSSVGIGDGPIDAAFTTIEQIIGHKYELDDFQINTVTEGRESMGQALVKLRADNGKLFSGNGISTDIIGASIRAYLGAVNKIVYEEEV